MGTRARQTQRVRHQRENHSNRVTENARGNDANRHSPEVLMNLTEQACPILLITQHHMQIEIQPELLYSHQKFR